MSSLSPKNASLLKELASFDDNTIKAIADSCINSLIDPNYENETSGNESNAQIGLATIITLFARQASSSDSLKTALSDAGISENSVNYICSKYNEKVDIIRAKLAQVSIAYPKIVGCDWRLDYAVSNSETGSVLKPIFMVKLKTEDGNTIDFTCNEEEMTSLVTSLKEATAEAQRTKY